MKIIAKSRLLKYFIAGLVIREAFSFWTGHPFDFELWVRLGYNTVQLKNPYLFLQPAPGLSFSYIFSSSAGATIGYLPFWPFVTALMYLLYSFSGVDNRFFYYFLLKQPIIFSDIAVAYLLYLYCRGKNLEAAYKALKFWLFIPFTIIISSIWGMFDSIAILFILLSLISRGARRSAWNGLAILSKSIPIIYSIPLSDLKFRRIAISIAIPVAISLLVFFLSGWSLSSVTRTLSSTVTKQGESMSVWELYYAFGTFNLLSFLNPSVTMIIGSLWIPAVLVSSYYAYRRFGFDNDYGLIQSCIMITLIFFIFKTQINEQYFLYLLVLMILDVLLWNKERRRLMNYMIIVATTFLFLNNYLMLNFISPAYPEIITFLSHSNEVIGTLRLFAKSALGIAFTFLNLIYLRKLIDFKPD